MDITIGIFAHVDAGKTTLSEDILYRTEAVNQLGRVDDQDTVMDNDAIEKRRGITIHADVAPFTIGEHHYYLIDTPGHMDFLGECQRVFPVLDYAILVVSASDGIQAHTENLYRMLRTHHIPLFVFVNKSDLASSQVDKTKLEIVRAWDNVWFEDQGKDELIQRIAESDETLLNQYMDEKINQGDYHNALKELVKNGEITLGFCGSALKSQGVDTLLQWMDGLVQTKYPLAGDFQAKIFRVRHDKNNRKVYYVKVEKGMIKVKDMVHFYADGEESSEKCDELFCVQGAKRIPTKELHSGMVGCIVGLTKAINGQWLGVSEEDFEREPFVLQASVVWDSSVPLTKILNEFKQLEEEEPLLKVTYLSKTNEIQVRVAGKIQLEVLIEEMALRFHETIAFLPCQVVYQETIGKETIGYGHFEPLRHYAEVHLQMTPGERGSGITFESKCKEDDLSINWQRLIETHVYEKIHKGVLTGSDLTDVQFCLIAGRSHLKHTEGGDFREATYRGIRQGLMSTKSVLLEPFYQFHMEAPVEWIQRLTSDLVRMSGVYETRVEEDKVIIDGTVVVRKFMDYYDEFMSITKGRGLLRYVKSGYQECDAQEEIVAEIGYDPLQDSDNIASSVFCSHGAGYQVPWDKVPDMVHVKS